jgi:hypothetical protein
MSGRMAWAIFSEHPFWSSAALCPNSAARDVSSRDCRMSAVSPLYTVKGGQSRRLVGGQRMPGSLQNVRG